MGTNYYEILQRHHKALICGYLLFMHNSRILRSGHIHLFNSTSFGVADLLGVTTKVEDID